MSDIKTQQKEITFMFGHSERDEHDSHEKPEQVRDDCVPNFQ